MKRNTLAKKLTAGLLTGVMVLSMGGMSALADQTVKGGNVDDALKKYLVMDENANVPNATFSYSIAAGDAVDPANGKPGVMSGIESEQIVISDTVFEPTDPTYNEEDGFISLDEGEKYAKETATVDFSEVTFNVPGIYRYKITENDTSVAGVTKDNNTIYLDVYVVTDGKGALSIDGYVLHKTVEVAGSDGNFAGADEKTTGFENNYTTADLQLSKTVTGNQGNRSQYFQFTVDISNAAAGTVYTVNLDNATYSGNPSTLTVGEDGTIQGTFYLHDGESIAVLGMTADTECQITEVLDETEGYTTTNDKDTVNEDSDGKTTDEFAIGENGTAVTFTNDKNVTTPTGIAMTFAPYAVMVAFAGVFAVVFLRKKREDF